MRFIELCETIERSIRARNFPPILVKNWRAQFRPIVNGAPSIHIQLTNDSVWPNYYSINLPIDKGIHDELTSSINQSLTGLLNHILSVQVTPTTIPKNMAELFFGSSYSGAQTKYIIADKTEPIANTNIIRVTHGNNVFDIHTGSLSLKSKIMNSNSQYGDLIPINISSKSTDTEKLEPENKLSLETIEDTELTTETYSEDDEE